MLTDKEELKILQNFAAAGRCFKNTDLEHLDAPMSAYNYVRIANIISRHFNKISDTADNTFLDWGAGYGQLTWLLKNRGINATGYNIEEREHISEIPELNQLKMVCGKDPVKLPFTDESFFGISSCGVLEHVENPKASLKEICRILKKGGHFYIFMLPQQTAWVEKLSEWRGISVHPVRYTIKSIKEMLIESGFSVEKLWKFNLIPKNLTGLPHRLKLFYGKFYKTLYPLDSFLSKIPLLNLLSGVIECVAKKN